MPQMGLTTAPEKLGDGDPSGRDPCALGYPRGPALRARAVTCPSSLHPAFAGPDRREPLAQDLGRRRVGGDQLWGTPGAPPEGMAPTSPQAASQPSPEDTGAPFLLTEPRPAVASLLRPKGRPGGPGGAQPEPELQAAPGFWPCVSPPSLGPTGTYPGLRGWELSSRGCFLGTRMCV